MPASDPAERALLARIAAAEKWARVPDRNAATAKARQALVDRFERDVDPEGKLDPAERALRAESARRAFYLRLALASAKARRARKYAETVDKEIGQAMAELDGEAS